LKISKGLQGPYRKQMILFYHHSLNKTSGFLIK
jgi:hypothetical protein